MTPYHDPAKFGLTMVGSIDYRDEYEFDIVAVFRDQQGRLGYLKDSGCSCPTPFDGMGVDTLTFCTPAELQAVLEERARENTWSEDSEGRYDAAILELMKRVVA
jgi:hypothetical protein